jgi:transposase
LDEPAAIEIGDWRERIFAALKAAEIRQVGYVPDAGHARLIELCHGDPAIRAVPLTSEEEGLPMRVVVHSAAIQDRDGAGLVLNMIRSRFPWLELIWADGGYHAWQVDAAVAKVPPLRMEIVKRSDDMKGFVVLPRRWVVERTFSWFGRNRRLAEPCRKPWAPSLLSPPSACPQAACQGVDRQLTKPPVCIARW